MRSTLYILLAVIALGILVLIHAVSVQDDKEEVVEVTIEEESTVIAYVQGALVPVLEESDVEGVDLQKGDTSVRVNEEGNFIFADVDPQTGIMLTHPALLRQVQLSGVDWLSAAGQIQIPFDPALYNALIRVLEAEARSDDTALYEYFAPGMREALTLPELFAQHTRIYTPENLTDQAVTIELVESGKLQSAALGPVSPTYRFTVAANGKRGQYTFWQDEDEVFYLVK